MRKETGAMEGRKGSRGEEEGRKIKGESLVDGRKEGGDEGGKEGGQIGQALVIWEVEVWRGILINPRRGR